MILVSFVLILSVLAALFYEPPVSGILRGILALVYSFLALYLVYLEPMSLAIVISVLAVYYLLTVLRRFSSERIFTLALISFLFMPVFLVVRWLFLAEVSAVLTFGLLLIGFLCRLVEFSRL